MQQRQELTNTILEDKYNTLCYDCKSEKNYPKYISINNGIFLCENCAKIHKKWDKQYSEIIKNNLSKLDTHQLTLLVNGGNSNLRIFIDNNFPKLLYLNPEQMYKTNALQYYRDFLHYRAYGGELPEKPDQNEGYKEIKEISFFDKVKNFFTGDDPKKKKVNKPNPKLNNQMKYQEMNTNQKNKCYGSNDNNNNYQNNIIHQNNNIKNLVVNQKKYNINQFGCIDFYPEIKRIENLIL